MMRRAILTVVLIFITQDGISDGFATYMAPENNKTFQHLLHRLQWKRVAVIFYGENENDCSVPDLAQSFASSPQFLLFDLSVVDTHDILQTIHDALFPDIHVVASMSPAHMTNLLKMVDSFDANTKGMTDFRHHSKWLLLAEGTGDPELQTLYLENVVVLRHVKCWIHNVLTLRRHPSKTELVPVADCTPSTNRSCYFPNVAYGYNNRHLLVTVLPESTAYTRKSVHNGTIQYRGYTIDILATIADVLNFSYSIIEPRDQSYGLPVNNTYDGIVGQLNRTEVDLAACDLTINEGRTKFIDYVYPPISTEYFDVMYKRHGKQGRSSLFLLTLPLRPKVYLVLFLIAGLCSILFAMFESVDIYLHKTPESEGGGLCFLEKLKQNLLHACWDVTGSLFKQGFSKYPRNVSGKVLMTSLWMLLMLISTVYCANLVAALSTQTDVKPFSDLEGLLNSDYSVGLRLSGISHHILKTNDQSSVYGKLWSKIKANDPAFLESSYENHLIRMEREKYALLDYKSELGKLMADDCQLEVLGERLLFVQQAFGLPKGSPLKADIEKIMYQMSAIGLLDRLWEKWSVKRNLTHCPQKRMLKSITLNQIGGGFIVVCAGTVLSIIVLCLEKLTYSLTR